MSLPDQKTKTNMCFRNRMGQTWLNRRVNATTLGAKLCFSFPLHPQLASSCRVGQKKNFSGITNSTWSVVADTTYIYAFY